MKTILHILSFEWKILWRSSLLKVLLLVVFGTGLYGIYFGKFEIEKQDIRIAEVKQYERQQFDSILVWVNLDTTISENKAKYQQAFSPTGYGRNKHFTYYVANQTPVAAGLCLGQRDLFPVYYGINVTDLARQLNVGELANPMKLLTGNFDLSYVFVFLFPLLIIALFYNLYAGEKEGGTLSLLQSQPMSLATILSTRALLRLGLVGLIATLLLLLGFILQGISVTKHAALFSQWLFAIYAYCLLWGLLMLGIVWLRRSAALSAMLGLGVWLIFALVMPAMLNLFVLAKEPLPNRTEVIHTLRTLNNQNWDNPKSFVFDQFYTDHPNYDQGDTTDFQKWYYAGFTLLDKEANAAQAIFEEQVNKRNALLEDWSWLAPAALFHERLAQYSGTNRASHMEWLQSLHNYHQELKDLYYQRIFDEEQFSLEDLNSLEQKL